MKPRSLAVAAVFFGPAAAAADQLASYALVSAAQRWSSSLFLLVITAAAASITLCGLFVEIGILRRKTEVFALDRFVATVGVMSNSVFLVIVLAGYGLPKLMLGPWD